MQYNSEPQEFTFDEFPNIYLKLQSHERHFSLGFYDKSTHMLVKYPKDVIGTFLKFDDNPKVWDRNYSYYDISQNGWEFHYWQREFEISLDKKVIFSLDFVVQTNKSV